MKLKTIALALLALSGLGSLNAAEAACPNAGFAFVARRASPETRPVIAADNGKTVLVYRDQITTSVDITELKIEGDEVDTLVLLKLTPVAAAKLDGATMNRAGAQLAFVLDDRALMIVTWSGSYGMGAELGVQLSMQKGMAKARALEAAMKQCELERGK